MTKTQKLFHVGVLFRFPNGKLTLSINLCRTYWVRRSFAQDGRFRLLVSRFHFDRSQYFVTLGVLAN